MQFRTRNALFAWICEEGLLVLITLQYEEKMKRPKKMFEII